MAYVRLFENVPLNNTYKNIIRFPNSEKRIEYFMNYEISYGDQPKLNFTCKDRTWLTAHVVIDTNQFDTFLSNIITSNYVIVDFDYGDDYYLVAPFKQGFYFVTDYQIKNKNSVILSLELDVATTYALGSGTILDGEIMTKRKHCNRFSEGTYGIGSYKTNLFDDKYANNGDVLDGIFEGSYPTKIYEYKQNTNPYNEPFNISDNPSLTRDEVMEYIEGYEWEMLVTTEPINANLSYFRFPSKYGTTGSTVSSDIDSYQYNTQISYSETRLFNGKSDISSSVYVYVYPKYKNDIRGRTMDYIFSTIKTLKLPLVHIVNGDYITFLKEPKLSDITTIVSRVVIPHNFVYSLIGRYATKTRIRVPKYDSTYYQYIDDYICFNFLDDKTDSVMNNVVLNAQESSQYVTRHTLFKDNYAYATQLQLTDIDYANDECWSYEDETETFYKYRLDDLSVTAKKDINLEPRLFKPPYSRYILKSLVSTSEGFEVNPLVSGPQIKVISKFVPSPGLLRFSYFPTSYIPSSPYNVLPKINVGNISTMDYSLPVKVDKWGEYIADRRNYAISGLVTPVALSSGVSIGTTLLTAKFNPIAVGGTIPGLTIGASNSLQAINNYLTTKDNLINAPDSVKNVGNDALSDFGLNVSLNPYVIVYELNDLQKQQVYDYYYRYGYQVNEFNKWNELFTRQRFNYIELSDDELYHKIKFDDTSEFNGLIQPGISLVVRNAIVNIFTRGVTVWEYDYSNMSLEYENLEIGIGSESNE